MDELATLDKLHTADLAAGPEAVRQRNAWRIRLRTRPRSSSVNPLYAYERRGADIYQPFQVPNGENNARFAFDVPWSGAAQALSVRIRACELPAHRATDIKARCSPKYTPDTHLIKTQPHMHARGVQLNGSVDDGGVGCFE